MEIAHRRLMAAALPFGMLVGFGVGSLEAGRPDIAEHVALQNIYPLTYRDRTWLEYRCHGQHVAVMRWGKYDSLYILHGGRGGRREPDPGWLAGYWNYVGARALGETAEDVGDEQAKAGLRTDDMRLEEKAEASPLEKAIDYALIGSGAYLGYRFATRHMPACDAPQVLTRVRQMRTWQIAAFNARRMVRDQAEEISKKSPVPNYFRDLSPAFPRTPRGDYMDDKNYGHFDIPVADDYQAALADFRRVRLAHENLLSKMIAWSVRLGLVAVLAIGALEMLKLIGVAVLTLLVWVLGPLGAENAGAKG